MDLLSALGVGLAIGMLAGTTGTHGSARGRMTILAAVIGLIAGFLLDGPLAAVAGLLGAGAGCVVISDLVSAAGRREGSSGGALGFIVALAAVVVAALALALPILVVPVILALAWLGFARHRRAQRKHAGLRVLR